MKKYVYTTRNNKTRFKQSPRMHDVFGWAQKGWIMNIYVIDLLPEEFDDMLTKVGRESRVQRGKSYPGLPEELKDFYCYYTDCGHSINAIPECLLQEAIDSGELSDYEAAVPVKYVLEKGYRF